MILHSTRLVQYVYFMFLMWGIATTGGVLLFICTALLLVELLRGLYGPLITDDDEKG